MKNLLNIIAWIIVFVLVAKGIMWAYEEFGGGGRSSAQSEVVDIDKDCRQDADSGQCICRHRRTGERLKIGYNECAARARGD